jgi:hypothetical protein
LTLNDKFLEWFKGDHSAVQFAEMLWTAAQEWDDLQDEGKCENHNSLLSWLAFGKEYHPFFNDNSRIMRPAMLSMYLQWTAANELERGDENDINKAYMLRAGLYGVFHQIAWICGGDEWAVSKGPEIYRHYGETLEELKVEFKHA